MNRKTKKLWQLVAILAVNLIMLILVSDFSARAVRLGGSGERVAEIQRELYRRNLFDGNRNGVFDFETKKGITEFQMLSGLEESGEADYETLSALGLNSKSSVCFSARAELLARCIQQSGCRTYPEMLRKGDEIIGETDGAQTLGKYISKHFKDFTNSTEEPSPEAYSAAIQAINKAAHG